VTRARSWLGTLPYARVLGTRDVRWFVGGLFVSAVGDGIALVCIPWLALEVAGDVRKGFAVAFTALAATAPGIPLALALRNRDLPPRTVLLVDSVWRAVLFAAIGALAAAHLVTLWPLVGLLAAANLLRTLALGARRALLASLVAPENRFAANSTYGVVVSLGMSVMGGAIGGLLVARGGPGPALIADAASFAFFAVVIAAGRAGAAPEQQTASRLRRIPSLAAWLIGITVAVNLLYGLVEVALPLLVRYSLRAGPTVYGEIVTAFGVGALVGVGAVGGARRRLPPERMAFVSVTGWGVAMIVLGLLTEAALAPVTVGIGALVYGPFTAASLTAIQSVTPPAALGRVMTLWSAAYTAALPVGIAIAGPVVSFAGPRATIVGSGLATCAVGGAWLARVARLPVTSPA
jgi:hypothetical protein